MLDPFFAPPTALVRATQPLADFLDLPALPQHMHEIMVFTLFFTLLFVLGPRVSATLFPNIYPQLRPKSKLHWDVAVVSMINSALIGSLALWGILADWTERHERTWQGRIWGYSGAEGFLGGVAMGYFIWHFVAMLIHSDVFGMPMVAHGISALFVTSVAFRPFVTHYLPIFLIYELSTQFLDMHRFIEWTGNGGSRIHTINGIILIVVFFLCRPVWGTYQTWWMFHDEWAALKVSSSVPFAPGYLLSATGKSTLGQTNVDHAYVPEPTPFWLISLHLTCGFVLLFLNYYWSVLLMRKAARAFVPKKGKTE